MIVTRSHCTLFHDSFFLAHSSSTLREASSTGETVKEKTSVCPLDHHDGSMNAEEHLKVKPMMQTLQNASCLAVSESQGA
jgi:hypothetical protein